jgi:hypothetical protein
MLTSTAHVAVAVVAGTAASESPGRVARVRRAAAPEEAISPTRMRRHLRRELEAHLIQLGYSKIRAPRGSDLGPEIVRVSPVRGRLVYGETVLRTDLRQPRCHERLLRFSRRRTRHRSTILFFIGVAEADLRGIETLLEQLEIRSATRGGHVHVVAIAGPKPAARRSEPHGQSG